MLHPSERKKIAPVCSTGLLIGLCLLCLHSFLSPPSPRVWSLLEQAQLELDNYQFRQALNTARQAELLLDADSNATVRLYTLMAQCLLKNDEFDSITVCENKLSVLPVAASIADQADYHFIHAYLGQLRGHNPDEVYARYRVAYDLYTSLPKPWHTNAGRIANNTGYILLVQKKEPALALEQFRLAEQIFTARLGADGPLIAHAYHNKGKTLADQKRFIEAQANYSRALSIRNASLGPEHPETLATILSFVVVQNALGNYADAEQNLLLALNAVIESRNSNMLSTLYANLGTSYLMGANFPQAIHYYKKGLEIETERNDSTEIATTLYNLGNAYMNQSEYPTALSYYQQAYKTAQPGHPQWSTLLTGLGNIYEKQGLLDQAEEKYRQALDYNKGRDNYVVVTNTYNLGNIYALRGNWSRALELNRESQQLLGYRGDGNLDQVPDILSLCEAMTQECRLLWKMYRHKGEMETLEAVRTACRNTISTFEAHARTIREPAGRQTMNETLFPVLEIALAANQRLHDRTGDIQYWRESFHLSEQARALRLYESLLEDAVLDTAISEEQRQKVYELRVAVDSARTQWLYQPKPGFTARDSVLFLKKIAVLKKQYDEYWDQLGREYPGLLVNGAPLNILTLEEVRKMLTPRQALLEYMVGDSAVFLFWVRKDTFQVFEGKSSDLIHQVRTLEEALKSPFSESPQVQMKYTRAAAELCRQLIPENPGYDLIVIPDGPLSTVPFEVLLSSTPPESVTDYQQYPFMIRDHCISYAYSATVLHAMSERQGRTATVPGVLGMAPFAGEKRAVFWDERGNTGPKQDSFSTIRGSGTELDSIRKYWPGRFYYGNDATIGHFTEMAPRYSILHLSTHGVAGSRRGRASYIVFRSAQNPNAFSCFYTHNLTATPLSADLVTLSACQTGLGAWQRGEGVFSLARSCAQAGAKSIVTTLWDINDKASSDIMARFYRHLSEGVPKDEALRRAKLEFMTGASFQSADAANPCLWSAFILIGDRGSIRR